MLRANPDTGLKVCSKCQTEQPIANFSRRARSADGLQPQCKECSRAAKAEWYAKNPEAVRQRTREWYHKNPGKKIAEHRRRRYGISPEDVIALRQAQGGKCPGCQRDLTTVRECVDHDHVTGKVRGLLCYRCNTFLGLMEARPDDSRRLIEYLKKPPALTLACEISIME